MAKMMRLGAIFVICEKVAAPMSGIRNPFVDLLNKYTTASPDHEAAFDEFIAEAPPPAGGPLRIQTKVEKLLQIRFAADKPPSIILTGNAGDGKTFLCRQILQTFTQKPIPDWEELAHTPLERNGTRLCFIKDLSELSEEEGKAVLKRLEDSLNPTSPNRYLIAANEGRLRNLLNRIEAPELRQNIEHQLRHGANSGSSSLVVIDLSKATTSVFVPETLRWMTSDVHWQSCINCPIVERCPIWHNARILRNERVVERVKLLYELLEHLDIHVTLRDMLIHLSFTLTGSRSCPELQQLDARQADLSYLAYYENILGGREDSPFRRKASVVQHLARLRLGEHSIFEIDNFIINGTEQDDQENIHAQLFVPAVDLNFKRFEQDRRAYIEGGAEKGALLEWLPHCRRKLFFEWHDERCANRLITFHHLNSYRQLLIDAHYPKDVIRKRLILGLNRAFSRLYLTSDDVLYLYIRPLVRLEIPANGIDFWTDPREDLTLDRCWRDLYLLISPPPELNLYRMGDAPKPQRWRLNLLVFEYLLRLADGGTFHVLADECELSIRDLKDRLISAFSYDAASTRIRFFVAERQQYILKTIYIDEKGVIRAGG